MKEITLLLNSCDSHSEAWLPFFTLLHQFWPTFDGPIALNTETKTCQLPPYDIQAIHTPSSVSWSDRFIKVLNRISTPFVLVFLEDFFIESPVDCEQFERCVQYMQQNQDVGCIAFRPSPEGTVNSPELPGYALLPRDAKYRVSCQVGLWRTSVLKKLLRKHENAWEFEVWASYRSKRTSYKFYSILPDTNLPFDYDWGKPIYRGAWNMESVTRIEKKTGIQISTKTLKQIPDMNGVSFSKRKRSLKFYFHRFKSFF